jgi:hypothetical protein
MLSPSLRLFAAIGVAALAPLSPIGLAAMTARRV